jgi:hypothetical protein
MPLILCLMSGRLAVRERLGRRNVLLVSVGFSSAYGRYLGP